MTVRLDRAFHVMPLAAPQTRVYPFLLAGIRILAALVVAGVAWRLVRAHATAVAGERLLSAVGGGRAKAPKLRVRLSPALWLISFSATALWFLIQNDAQQLSQGGGPLLGPWLHTYALPVFAVLSVVLAVGWGLVRDWVSEVERYAVSTFVRACRIVRTRSAPPRRCSPFRDRAPRLLFGLAFESRPPPLPA